MATVGFGLTFWVKDDYVLLLSGLAFAVCVYAYGRMRTLRPSR